SSTTRPMARVSWRPRYVQVSPPSVERYTPPPHEELWRLLFSPVPAQMIFESRSKIASAPNVLSACLPNTSFQVTPLLTDFQMPPDAAPTYRMAGFFGSIWMSWMRPPLAAGPMSRKCNASNGPAEDRSA